MSRTSDSAVDFLNAHPETADTLRSRAKQEVCHGGCSCRRCQLISDLMAEVEALERQRKAEKLYANMFAKEANIAKAECSEWRRRAEADEKRCVELEASARLSTNLMSRIRLLAEYASDGYQRVPAGLIYELDAFPFPTLRGDL